MGDKIVQHLREVAPYFEDAKPLMRAAANRIEALQAERDAAVLAEREECARECEKVVNSFAYFNEKAKDMDKRFAAAIRARSNEEPRCPDCDLPNPDSNPYCFCKPEPSQ